MPRQTEITDYIFGEVILTDLEGMNEQVHAVLQTATVLSCLSQLVCGIGNVINYCCRAISWFYGIMTVKPGINQFVKTQVDCDILWKVDIFPR